MGNRYRRRLLVALTEHNPQDIGEPNAEDAFDAVDDIDDPGRIEILHTHLPKLQTYGYVNVDEPTGSITKGPNWDEIEPLVLLFKNNDSQLPVDWL